MVPCNLPSQLEILSTGQTFYGTVNCVWPPKRLLEILSTGQTYYVTRLLAELLTNC